MSPGKAPDWSAKSYRDRLTQLTLLWYLNDLKPEEFVSRHRTRVVQRVAELAKESPLREGDLPHILLGALDPGTLPQWFQLGVDKWLDGWIQADEIREMVAKVRELDRYYRTVLSIGIIGSRGEFLSIIPPGVPLNGESEYGLREPLTIPANTPKLEIQVALASPNGNRELLDSHGFQLSDAGESKESGAEIKLCPHFERTPPAIDIVLIVPGTTRRMGTVYLPLSGRPDDRKPASGGPHGSSNAPSGLLLDGSDPPVLDEAAAVLAICLNYLSSRQNPDAGPAEDQIAVGIFELAKSLRSGDLDAIRTAGESLVAHVTRAGPVAVAFFALRTLEFYADMRNLTASVETVADLRRAVQTAAKSGDEQALIREADRVTRIAFRWVAQTKPLIPELMAFAKGKSEPKDRLQSLAAILGVTTALPEGERTITLFDFLNSGLSHNLPQNIRNRLEEDLRRTKEIQWSVYQSEVLKKLVESSSH